MQAYIMDPTNGLLKRNQAAPFTVSMQYLPSVYLQRVQNDDSQTLGVGDETASFQMRISGADGKVSLPRLLQQQALPDWSLSRQRHALFYEFEQVCQLQLGGKTIKPLFATVEMTTQTQRELSVVFVFPMTASQLRQQSTVRVTLLPTFFTRQPVAFWYDTANLLAVYPHNATVYL